MRTLDIFVLLAALSATGACPQAFCSETGSSITKAQRLQFLAGYHSWSPKERREAIRELTKPEFRNQPEIGDMLFKVAWFNEDPEARLYAFQALCTWHDADGSLTAFIAKIFRHEKERAIKPAMAQAMTRLPFKAAMLDELIRYIRLPGVRRDHCRDSSSIYVSSDSPVGVKMYKHRRRPGRYQILLNSINQISGKRFVHSRDTSRELNEWWKLNAIDYRYADHKLAQQKKAGQDTQVALADADVKENLGAKRLEEMLKKIDADAKRGAMVKVADAGAQQRPALNEDEIE